MILWKHNLFKWSVTILLARSPGLQSRRMLGEHSTIPKLLALSLTWKRCQLLILDEKINQRLWQSMNTSIPMTSKFGEKKMLAILEPTLSRKIAKNISSLFVATRQLQKTYGCGVQRKNLSWIFIPHSLHFSRSPPQSLEQCHAP